ncbi:hypothetical protein STIAU_4494, partial [Stigmatella aurantiaca DW4/3-1]
LRAPERGLEWGVTLLDVAGNVLGDHDRVVDDEAGGNGECHQREVVDAVSAKVHHRERADQREWHGDAGDDRGAGAAQEDEHHPHHQRHAEQQRQLHVGDRGADGTAAIQHHLDVDGRRDGVRQRRQQRLHPLDHVDDVGAGLAPDDERDGSLAVRPCRHPLVLHALEDTPDIP